MHPSLVDIEHAASVLIDGIFYEEQRLLQLENDLQQSLSNQAGLVRLHGDLMIDPSIDDEGLGTMSYWDAHFEASKIDRLERQIDALKREVALREYSAAALSGSLRQIAKQILSEVYGSPLGWPVGRKIGSQSITMIIHQARNQAMHFEESKSLRREVIECFMTLERDFGNSFSIAEHPQTNFAFNVVKLLGWRSFTIFDNDLSKLLPADE